MKVKSHYMCANPANPDADDLPTTANQKLNDPNRLSAVSGEVEKPPLP